jgi:hypothetical protein
MNCHFLPGSDGEVSGDLPLPATRLLELSERIVAQRRAQMSQIENDVQERDVETGHGVADGVQ